jgi:signal transduction histidine kinase
VDDQEETLVSARLLLEKEGHRVLTAASGEEALALFRPGDVQLILMDYFMPGMSGEGVVQAIRQRDADVQIVLMTGYAGEKPPREMLHLLAIQGYHDKTEGPDRLLLWVDVALKAYTQLNKVQEATQEVARSRTQLRLLSTRLLFLQEEERERISRELYDQLGQLLTAIELEVDWTLYHYSQDLLPLGERLEGAASLIQEALRIIRASSAGLRPEALQRFGLEAALQQFVAEFEQHSGLPVHFSSQWTAHAVPPEAAMHIYRMVQEACKNVAHHAAATAVWVELTRTEQRLTVSVVDNGQGFDVARLADLHTVGIVSMQERAQLVGGRLAVRSAPGAGTSVRLEIPLL